MSPNESSPLPSSEPRYSTRLETDEEVRSAIQAHRARLDQQRKPGGKGEAPAIKPLEDEVRAERPVSRPPVALLCILDDDKQDGEVVRLRNDVTVIGRTEGDILIPHDGLISSRHAQIVRKRETSGYRWLLSDLQSTNGTFLRIGSAVLRNDFEVIIGGGRYRFAAGSSGAATADLPAAIPQSTRPWDGPPVREMVASFVEITVGGPPKRTPLTLSEYWIGRDIRTCSILRSEDPLVNACHARLFRDERGNWHIENNKSVNGLWLRITGEMPIGGPCQFRMGEQRFIFRPS